MEKDSTTKNKAKRRRFPQIIGCNRPYGQKNLAFPVKEQKPTFAAISRQKGLTAVHGFFLIYSTRHPGKHSESFFFKLFFQLCIRFIALCKLFLQTKMFVGFFLTMPASEKCHVWIMRRWLRGLYARVSSAVALASYTGAVKQVLIAPPNLHLGFLVILEFMPCVNFLRCDTKIDIVWVLLKVCGVCNERFESCNCHWNAQLWP